jgi:Co/Zn/Cd efflux system component
MDDCCNDDLPTELIRAGQRGTLRTVLAINAVAFVVLLAAALAGRSSALLADSLDDLGDALTYGLSLYAVSRGARTKAWVALFKGVLIALAALGVACQIAYRFLVPAVPVFQTMGWFGALALAANSVCLFLLWRHRHEDVNMSSVWECSRNDIAANLAVLVAAAGVWASGSRWPDLLVALGLVVLLVRSAGRVVGSAVSELRASAA